MRALVPWQVVSSLVLSSRPPKHSPRGLARAAAGELSRRVVECCAQRAVRQFQRTTASPRGAARLAKCTHNTQGKPVCTTVRVG